MPLDRLKCPGPLCKTVAQACRAGCQGYSVIAAALHPAEISAFARNILDSLRREV